MTKKSFPLEKILTTSLGDYINFWNRGDDIMFQSEKYDLIGISVEGDTSLSVSGYSRIKKSFADSVPINTEVVLEYNVVLSQSDHVLSYVANGVALVKKKV